MKSLIYVFIVVTSFNICAQDQNVVVNFNSLLKQVEKIEYPEKRDAKEYFDRDEENFYIKQYLCFHPEKLDVFYKKQPELFKKWSHLGGTAFINRTNASDKFVCWQLKQKYPNNQQNFYKTPLDRKYNFIRLIFKKCIGTKHTLDLLTFVDKEYPEPKLDILFNSEPSFINVFSNYKQTIKNNVDLYEEIGQLTEKDIQGWQAVTFSYAHKKYKEYNLENKKGQTTQETKSSKSPMAVFMQDFMHTFNSKNTVKVQKKIDSKKLIALFKTLKERGGQCDFRSERLIKKITFYQSYAPGMSVSKRWSRKITENNCAFLGDQTLIFDSNGKFRYIFSRFYGKVPMTAQEFGGNNIQGYLRNWLFSFGKVVYKDDKPVNFIATQILADGDIFKQIDSSIRSDLKINLLDMLEDDKENDTFEGPYNYCFYDLQKLGFKKMRGRLSYNDFLFSFPKHPKFKKDTKTK